jgi:hypothetical protein
MRVLTIVLLTLASAAPTAAQPAPPAKTTAAAPDVAIIASAHAREVRFDTKPDVRVNVWGEVNGRPAATVSTTDRENLPEGVQPYVTYRDIGILLTITSTLPDIETILDEALAPPSPPAQSDAMPKPAAKPPSRKKSRR